MTTTIKHKVDYTESKPGFLDYHCEASCSCGWSYDAQGSWPSDARGSALIAGLRHTSDSYFHGKAH